MALFHDLIKNVPAQRIEAPDLFGGIVVGEENPINAFIKRFGGHWRKTPAKGVWCLTEPGLQFTMTAMGDVWDIAAYPYETVSEFRVAFEKGTHAGNAAYFQTQPGDKYTGLAVIRYMQKNNLL